MASAAIFFSSLASAQPDLRGIYIYTNDVSTVSNSTATLLTQSFNIPGVDGVAIVIGWNAIEPSIGQYQWTVLGQWIAKASALGKKIDLVIPAGSSIPAWLFAPPPSGPEPCNLPLPSRRMPAKPAFAIPTTFLLLGIKHSSPSGTQC